MRATPRRPGWAWTSFLVSGTLTPQGDFETRPQPSGQSCTTPDGPGTALLGPPGGSRARAWGSQVHVPTCGLEAARPGSLGQSPRPLRVWTVACRLGPAAGRGHPMPMVNSGLHQSSCLAQTKAGRAHRHFMPPHVSSARGHWLWALSRAGGRAPGPAWRSAQRPDSGSAVGILRARAESPPHTWPVWAPRASSILSPQAWPRLPTQSPDALPQLLGPCHVSVTCQASGSARAARLPRPRDAWGSSRPALGSPAVGHGGAPGV